MTKRTKAYKHFDEKIANEVCEALSTTSFGIKRLCKDNPHWPSYRIIYRWLFENKDFRNSYARAKANQIEIHVEEILEISDNSDRDIIETEDGKKIVNHEHINRSRLMVDSRKWLAAKLSPRIYGDRVFQETSQAINSIENAVEFYKSLNEDDRLTFIDKIQKLHGVE